jgi:hypothetical protein
VQGGDGLADAVVAPEELAQALGQVGVPGEEFGAVGWLARLGGLKVLGDDRVQEVVG